MPKDAGVGLWLRGKQARGRVANRAVFRKDPSARRLRNAEYDQDDSETEELHRFELLVNTGPVKIHRCSVRLG